MMHEHGQRPCRYPTKKACSESMKVARATLKAQSDAHVAELATREARRREEAYLRYVESEANRIAEVQQYNDLGTE